MDRTEDEYEDLVALSGVVGWPVPVRWALVVLGWMVTVTPNLFLFSLRSKEAACAV